MKTAILIEGAKGIEQYCAGDFSKALSTYPEVYHLQQLAFCNGWQYFDPICSMDSEHFHDAFTKFPSAQHERVVHSILDFYRQDFERDDLTLALHINPAYSKYLNGKPLPDWFSALQGKSNADIAKQKQAMMAKIYLPPKYPTPEQGFNHDRELILKWLMKSSNRLSCEALKAYCESHPDVTRIIGLVGGFHLNFVDGLGKVLDLTVARNITYQLGERKIDIFLFPNIHGKLAGYTILEDFVKKLGFKVPSNSPSQASQADTLALIDRVAPLVPQFSQLAVGPKTELVELPEPSQVKGKQKSKSKSKS